MVQIRGLQRNDQTNGKARMARPEISDKWFGIIPGNFPLGNSGIHG